jgi:type II secretory pathway pseudopilin PulG
MRTGTSPSSPLSHRTPIPRERGSAAAGYNLVMLMVLLTVLNIAVAASLPAWSAVIRRDKEEELVFRGLQYAEAIRVFKNRFQREPVRLEELIEVEPRSIRRLWKDPMTENGKWALIPLQGPPGPQPQPDGLNPPGKDDPEDPENDPEREDDAFGPKKDEIQVGPFKGVHSRSRKTSFLLFNGKERYDEWHFTVELFTGAPQQHPGGDPAAPPPGTGQFQMSARWIGRPFPAFLQPPQGSGLDGGQEPGFGGSNGRPPRPGKP